ncbi:KaiA family protein [Pseudanabaena sp. UWO310]|nr:KaiA family protein [Pseudanabaena sp. UWO310]
MPVLSNLQVCCLVAEANVNQTKSSLAIFLPEERYTFTVVSDVEAIVSLLTKTQNAQDCLVIFKDIRRDIEAVFDRLGKLNIFIPTILVLEDLYEQSEPPYEYSESKDFYRASISIHRDQLPDLPIIIDQAIATFIKISPQIQHQVFVNIPYTAASESLNVQQQRLAQKLNERLGYLGVYYKRDSRLFLRNLSPEDRKEYIERLKNIYRSIVLEYFLEKNDSLNQKIDEFVNLSFFADISVSQVLEIHMELMDEFAKQLRLEGRNDEILLDYRITLIDMIAHLCELYRRSIPRS